MAVKFKNDWNEKLNDEFQKDYYKHMRAFLKQEYYAYTVYPPMEDIFNALNYTSYGDTKVLILGQDPYHGPNQAHGLCFSVNPKTPVPPSLQNIYKELKSDLGLKIPNNGYLRKWAHQGVLLLNAVLTVRAGMAGSHSKIGWHEFTDHIISLLNEKHEPVVFILWGKYAQSKEHLITNKRHLVIKSPHPSPLSASRGFFGSRPFSRTNDFLSSHGLKEIDWQIEDI
ncbi:uracil-DNA glycosylase [Alkalibacter saccharofermentans]|uniref:Uracil-DNA glycosylase n=1 Tax=Alkalibacter saccharofermentans DSM 14828 TaxID=1120975 RepID=A0A1M4YLZ7_9FIRM|nr:uracil-DNA glycosylase [Alkalibacter saccharofermentans]SHF06839.1 Uracil-DNA glycosylase [Alkalibacter saccharofermentans DSM 14828]